MLFGTSFFLMFQFNRIQNDVWKDTRSLSNVVTIIFLGKVTAIVFVPYYFGCISWSWLVTFILWQQLWWEDKNTALLWIEWQDLNKYNGIPQNFRTFQFWQNISDSLKFWGMYEIGVLTLVSWRGHMKKLHQFIIFLTHLLNNSLLIHIYT
jgi:hypothetical protein